MKKKIDKEWAKTVWTNLHSPVVDPRSIIVNEYLGRRADQRDGVTDSGLAFAFKLKDKYREGQCLGLPGDDGWLIGPEYMFNRDLSLGHFDDSLVLAIIAARDPSNVLSLAATARLTPRATDRELVSEILTGVGA